MEVWRHDGAEKCPKLLGSSCGIGGPIFFLLPRQNYMGLLPNPESSSKASKLRPNVLHTHTHSLSQSRSLQGYYTKCSLPQLSVLIEASPTLATTYICSLGTNYKL